MAGGAWWGGGMWYSEAEAAGGMEVESRKGQITKNLRYRMKTLEFILNAVRFKLNTYICLSDCSSYLYPLIEKWPIRKRLKKKKAPPLFVL